jgi:hypothetical protein
MMAAYDACVTSSTPTGSAASSSSQLPTRPSAASSAAVSVQPTQPPVAMIPPRVMRTAANVSAACCRIPAAAMSSSASPASGTQPLDMRGLTNAATPHAPSSIGSRKPA